MPKRQAKQTASEGEGKLRKLSHCQRSAGSVGETSIGSLLHHSNKSVADAECRRLRGDDDESWRRWGPYLSERQWGTVREDHSTDGSCWDYFPHDDAVFRAYEYGEDGLLGICDDQAQLCLSLALWNGKDKFLKERLFGLTGPQGNHGEDVKELYYYLDSTPTHSYMRALYKYPQSAFPYSELLNENAKRSNKEPEYEILDTGAFDKDAYWDVYAEYAKETPTDLLCQYTVYNRGKDTSTIHVLPTLWFRNTWMKAGIVKEGDVPQITLKDGNTVLCSGLKDLGNYRFAIDQSNSDCEVPFLFTNNETNVNELKVQGSNKLSCEGCQSSDTKFYKDGINEHVVNQKIDAVNGAKTGTKCATWFKLTVEPGQSAVIRCRLYNSDRIDSKNTKNAKITRKPNLFGKIFCDIMAKRIAEAEAFYKMICGDVSSEESLVMRQALAGLCWTKQYYSFDGQRTARNIVKNLSAQNSSDDDSRQTELSLQLNSITASSLISLNNSSLCAAMDKTNVCISRRNIDWPMLSNSDVISMPDKWEFPWYATWDLAFHMIPFGLIDLKFAKSQLLLFLSDRFLHPRGQLPAYEFNFSDVNPPVHAWACLKIYRQSLAQGDCNLDNIVFLKKCFSKLVVNFTWWVNQKDTDGSFLFEGGFLGMDNVSCLHRSELPKGFHLKQADGTAWMAFYSLCMLDIALELAQTDICYEDMAITYLSYFSHIVENINGRAGLWNAMDGFFYDRLTDSHQVSHDVSVRCMIGLTCLFPVLELTEDRYRTLPVFTKHLNSLLSSVTRGRLSSHESFNGGKTKQSPPILLSLVNESQLRSLLHYALDDDEMLSPYGIRALSKAYKGEKEYKLSASGQVFTVSYCPAESNSSMFGGNSNWRGPIWLCMNYLLLESLDIFGSYLDDSFKVPMPTKSSNMLPLDEVTLNIRKRLISIFTAGNDKSRPLHGKYSNRYANDPHFKDLVLFYEYFNGDNGAGCGASHQTGWTALVANLIHQHNQQMMRKSS